MDEFTDNLQNEVNVVKRNEKWEVEYMTLLMRDNEKKKEGRKEYQLLLRAIPKESDDFTLALTAEDDVIEALMEKYNIYSEE